MNFLITIGLTQTAKRVVLKHAPFSKVEPILLKA